MDLPKYLVRPDDFAIFELDNSNFCYRYLEKTFKENKFNAQSHFTFQNLTENYNFFPVKEEDLPQWEEKHQLYMDYISWFCRPDGHGGSKGGTMEEYLTRVKYLNNTKN